MDEIKLTNYPKGRIITDEILEDLVYRKEKNEIINMLTGNNYVSDKTINWCYDILEKFEEKLEKEVTYDFTLFFITCSFLEKFKKLSFSSLRIYLRTLKDLDPVMNCKQVFRFNTKYKELLSKELGYKTATINQAIYELARNKLLIKIQNGKYYISPKIAFKGSRREQGKICTEVFELTKNEYLKFLDSNKYWDIWRFISEHEEEYYIDFVENIGEPNEKIVATYKMRKYLC